MADIRPFCALRPAAATAEKIAALPYDVYDRAGARAEVAREPLSFLHIDRPESWFDDDVNMYDPVVYEKAAQVFSDWIDQGYFINDDTPCYYIYQEIMDGRAQTGIVACASVNDYTSNIIKKHEKTRETKMEDRIAHIEACQAQTGPIFLAYRENPALRRLVEKNMQGEPLYDFIAPDAVAQKAWRIDDADDIAAITECFAAIRDIYIADGHHRAASAVSVSLRRREKQLLPPGIPAGDESDYFLCVLFPENELKIMAYNRAVQDLNGLKPSAFLDLLKENFDITQLSVRPDESKGFPSVKGEIGMYLDRTWYLLHTKESVLQAPLDPQSDRSSLQGNVRAADPVKSLDVSILQDYVLEPLLGIIDPRRDNRIDFIGGIHGLAGLENYCNNKGFSVAFAMFPTSIQELFAVADRNALMPPKSTWFEPKLRSGLFIHRI